MEYPRIDFRYQNHQQTGKQSGVTLTSASFSFTDATIILTDQQGRTIQRIVLPAGQKTTEINTKELASGVYYVRVISGTMTRTQKLIRK